MGGDAEAFSDWCATTVGLRNLLRRLSRDPALADDLAQQVFLKAWRALPRCAPSVLSGLAASACRHHLAGAPALRPAAAAELDPDELAGVPVTPGPAMSRSTSTARSRPHPDERLCLVLTYSEGMSHGEISTRPACPSGR